MDKFAETIRQHIDAIDPNGTMQPGQLAPLLSQSLAPVGIKLDADWLERVLTNVGPHRYDSDSAKAAQAISDAAGVDR